MNKYKDPFRLTIKNPLKMLIISLKILIEPIKNLFGVFTNL